MDLKIAIPAGTVIGIIALRGALALIEYEFELPAGFRGVDLIIILGVAAVILFAYMLFVAPVVFERHRKAMAPESRDDSFGGPEQRAAMDFLQRSATTLLVLAVMGAGIWLSLFRYPLEPDGGMHPLYGAGLVLVGIGFSTLLMIWAFKLPDLPDSEPFRMPFNGALTHEEAQSLVGREGVVQAALRPQGNLKLDGVTYVVRSEGHFVEEGTLVRVDRVDGLNIVVVPLPEEG